LVENDSRPAGLHVGWSGFCFSPFLQQKNPLWFRFPVSQQKTKIPEQETTPYLHNHITLLRLCVIYCLELVGVQVKKIRKALKKGADVDYKVVSVFVLLVCLVE